LLWLCPIWWSKVFPRRSGFRPLRYFDCLWIFEIHHGVGFGSLESAHFLPAGLILAALVMLVMGFVPWATSSIMVMFVLLFLCGWFQGWAGRRAGGRWCTGGRRKNAAALSRCGTARITWGRDPTAAVPAGDGLV
jgi:hypothetical protein